MKVIAWVEVICDDCGKTLRRRAVPHTKIGRRNEKRLMRRLQRMALGRGWRMEGAGDVLWAGDWCRDCWRAELKLVEGE